MASPEISFFEGKHYTILPFLVIISIKTGIQLNLLILFERDKN